MFSFVNIFRKKSAESPHAEGASIVLTIEEEAYYQPPCGVSLFVSPRLEPPLKNSQPTHKIKVPRAT